MENFCKRFDSRNTVAILLGAFIYLCATGAKGETLTGIVRQPSPPFMPAADSTVTMYDAKNRRIGSPTTTTRDGRYRFTVEKGLSVTVRAVWDAEASMPGATIATVIRDPTEADVQLQPPRSSPESVWYESGVTTAKIGSWSAVATASSLQTAQLSAPSRYQFIVGAKNVDATAFKGIDDLAIFDSKNSVAVTQGLQIAEGQFQKTKTLPTYAQLNGTLANALTVDVYLQLLGFMAPSDSASKSVWSQAVATATNFDPDRTLVWAQKIDKSVSPLVYQPDDGVLN